MINRFLLLSFLVKLISPNSQSQEIIPLYSGPIPNSKETANEETSEKSGNMIFIKKISFPTITVYPAPAKLANGAAIIIFPGGGYGMNAYLHEGTEIAKILNQWGVSAFVVKYRLPDEHTMIEPFKGPLQDAQQAMLLVRSKAVQWNLDRNRIGIMGFSAGGHLASSLGVHYANPWIDNPSGINLRPDFMILGYPVISSDSSISHKGSFDQLLKKNYRDSLLQYFSSEKQVTAQTAPCFLVHATDDDVVPVKNSIVFYEALVKQGVSAEIHIYEKGSHGFGIHNPSTKDKWMERCRNWMVANGWLKKKHIKK